MQGHMEIKASIFCTGTVKRTRKINLIAKEMRREHRGKAAEGQHQIICTNDKQTALGPHGAPALLSSATV